MIVYGRNVAKEVLKNNKKVNKIFIQKDFADKEIISLIEKRNLYYEILDKKDITPQYLTKVLNEYKCCITASHYSCCT